MSNLRRFVLGCLLSLVFGSAPLWAAISVYPGAITSRLGNGSLAAVTPGNVLSGDLLVAQVVAQSTATISAPSGWTQVNSASVSSGAFSSASNAL